MGMRKKRWQFSSDERLWNNWLEQPRLELRPGFPALAPRLQSSTGGSPTARDSLPSAAVAHLFIYLFLSFPVWPFIFAFVLYILDCLPIYSFMFIILPCLAIYLFIYSSNFVPGLNLWKQYKKKISSNCQNSIFPISFLFDCLHVPFNASVNKIFKKSICWLIKKEKQNDFKIECLQRGQVSINSLKKFRRKLINIC